VDRDVAPSEAHSLGRPTRMNEKVLFLLRYFRLLICSSDGPENAPKYAFRGPKIKKKYGEGLPSHQTLSPMGIGHPSHEPPFSAPGLQPYGP